METVKLNWFTNDTEFPFFIHYGGHDDNVKMHIHDDFTELVIILSGNALHTVNDESYPIKKGDVFLINKDTAHGYTETNDFRICNIMFNPNWFENYHFDIKKSAGFHALFVIEPQLTKARNFKSKLMLNPSDFNSVSDIISEMINEYDGNQIGSKTLIMSDFMKLAVLLSRAYGVSKKLIKGSVYYIASAVSYMETHFTEHIRISELSAMTHLSERHFTRIFYEAYHTTPTDYIQSLRMKHARNLLKNTSLSVSDISVQSGFYDSNYFARRFRKLYNTSPSAFRSDK